MTIRASAREAHVGAEGAWRRTVDRRLSHLEVDVATLKNDVAWIRRLGGVMLTLQVATIAAVLRA
ncbi:MAG TPA: hypothetical protein VNU01_07115 [Egibacteraceae bacterium]|nr:hypothetical protein [Egibacteraceae bacterium]